MPVHRKTNHSLMSNWESYSISSLEVLQKWERLQVWRSVSLGQKAATHVMLMKRGILQIPSAPKNKGKFLTHTNFQRTQEKFLTKGLSLCAGIQEGTNKDRLYNSGPSWMSSRELKLEAWKRMNSERAARSQCVFLINSLEKATVGCGLISRSDPSRGSVT